jgi:hypothetical protein
MRQRSVRRRSSVAASLAVVLVALVMAVPADAEIVKSGGLTYVTRSIEPTPNEVRTLTAKCPPGTHVWAGGHYNTGGFGEAFPRHSYPYDSGDKGRVPDDGWKVQTSAGEGVVVRIHATCAEPEPRYERGSLPVPPNSQGGTEIDCDPDFEAVSGGTSGNRDLNEVKSGPAFGFGWFVAVDNYAQDTRTIKTFAICIKRERFDAADNDEVLPRTQEGHTASCPAGTRIVGGGVGNIGPFTHIAIAASSPQGIGNTGADGWQVYLDNFDDTTTYAFSVFATCVEPLN